MSARWTDKMAILQDLAYAQGSAVPVDIENPLSYNEKPPREVFEEETEEQYYNDCMPNGDFSNGPDIGMIQELLEAVRNSNTSPDLENTNDMIEISKLNIRSPDYKVPGYKPGASGDHQPGPETSQEPKKITPKKKRNRNAAIVSLIETYGEQSIPHDDQEAIEDKALKLLKPNDFMLSNEEKISQEKVTSWLNSVENRLPSPANMFRKKKVTSDGASKMNVSPVTSRSENENSTEVYVPSSLANEYYEKYIERSKTKEAIKEDIWTRAERIMMEIDEKRKREKEDLSAPSNTDSVVSEMETNTSNVTDQC